MLRFLTAGESHGPAQIAILEGMPAGLVITSEDIQKELAKRHHDAGRGGRSAIETDMVEILSGIRHGKTIGSPIAVMVRNSDFTNWEETMSTEKLTADSCQLSTVTTPRPGHADFAGVQKYGFSDIRNILERASARETVMRVAVGSMCKILLAEFGIAIASHTIQIGNQQLPTNPSFTDIKNVSETDPDTRCTDAKTAQLFKKKIMEARKNKDTLGGVNEVIAHNVPVGLGSHVHWDRKLDGNIAQALMSIPSVKAVAIGEAIANTKKPGSKTHDAIQENGTRSTNRAGGIEGGISNGEDIVVHVYHKPLPTLMQPLDSIDITTGQKATAHVERSDVCVVPRAGIIAESMLAFVLARELLVKFGGDNIKETKANFKNYTDHNNLISNL